LNRSLRLILGIFALLLILWAGNAQSALYNASAPSADQSTATKSEIIVPDAVAATEVENDPPIEMMIPYTKTSFWNTPIGPSPKYDPYSDEMIATLELARNGEMITPDTYNYPVYFADADTPRYDLPCTRYRCVVGTADGGTRTDMLKDVPIPLNAQPAPDTDARMIIIDRDTYAEYDLWRVEQLEDGWTIGSGSSYNILWDGTPPANNSRGSGIPAYAGLLRPWEIRQGRIQHALAFGYTEPAEEKCVFPASKTDGDSKIPFAIPEGARLQLDPSLTEDDFDRWGLDRTGKIIARALQEYGMVSVDHSGSYKIYIEDLTNNPFTTERWTDPDLNLTKETISSIPYTSFRVLELPPGYWEPSEDAVYHGRCLTFPGIP
jgi:hypothetical protein